MRNLQKLLFVSLMGVTLGSGCTITTSDGTDFDDDRGGTGGTSTTVAGNTSVTGGTVGVGGTTTVASATGGSATGGASTTVPVYTYTAADCPTLATISPPPYAADVTLTCVQCMYSANKACTEAAACHNDAACVQQVYSALECIQLNYAYLGDLPIPMEERDACQNGDFASATPPGGSESMTIKSTTPTEAWKGATVGPTGMTLMSAVVTKCAVECNATIEEAAP